VPLYTAIREGGDAGIPVVVSAPDSAAGQAFMAIAQRLMEQVQ
jgi:ATP-binding protein involved in chromosome partitioning